MRQDRQTRRLPPCGCLIIIIPSLSGLPYTYTVPTTNVWHFLVKYLAILENKVQQYQISYSKILTCEEQVCKVSFKLCIYNSNPMVGTMSLPQVGNSSFNNFDKYEQKKSPLLIFLATPFVNYVVPNICRTSVVCTISKFSGFRYCMIHSL
jgi:hypothetical protein